MNPSGIHGIGTGPVPPTPQPDPPGRAKASGGASPFADLVRQAVEAVDRDQQAAAGSVEQLLTGRQRDILPVVTAVAKADASFKLLVAVRNKMIEAYKQTMNMQV